MKKIINLIITYILLFIFLALLITGLAFLIKISIEFWANLGVK